MCLDMICVITEDVFNWHIFWNLKDKLIFKSKTMYLFSGDDYYWSEIKLVEIFRGCFWTRELINNNNNNNNNNTIFIRRRYVVFVGLITWLIVGAQLERI